MNVLTVLSLLVILCVLEVIAFKKDITIGVIFHKNDTDAALAFKYAISRFNMFSLRYRAIPKAYFIPEADAYETGIAVCEMVQSGVTAIFGPSRIETNEIVQSVSETLEIPQFQHFWNPKLGSNAVLTTTASSTTTTTKTAMDRPIRSFNLYPESTLYAKALATLLREMNWKTYTIIYENEDGLVRLQEILKMHNRESITVRKLNSGSDHRTLLKEIKASSEFQIILDCHVDNIYNILEQAVDVKLTDDYNSFILTSLDSHTLDLSRLNLKLTNITTLRLIDPNTTHIRNVIRDWELGERYEDRTLHTVANSVRTETALLYDAVNLFLTAYQELDITGRIETKPLSCEQSQTSEYGLRIFEYIKVKYMHNGTLIGPLTGPIKFDYLGRRRDFKLQIVELQSNVFRQTGEWDSNKPNDIHFTFTAEERKSLIEQQIQEKVFRVVSRIGAPYLMKREQDIDGPKLEGNSRFQGYALDLIDGISKILNFTYRFELVDDNNYGSIDAETGEWNGLIRELLDKRADLAICDLTITYERRSAVDFTMPFMTLGISILYSKPKKDPPALFSFMQPLSLDVWLYMATAYLIVTLTIFVVARLSPGNWENPHPCENNPETLENIWTIRNCFWLTLGSIMAQGCDILPKGVSTRMVLGVWWFFCLIINASYTANMAAFLTMERMGPTIESAEDLAKQTKIKYGAVEKGATSSFFEKSNFSTYHRMWVNMQSQDESVFVKSNGDGVKRVLTSKGMYAFLMESSSIEYEIAKNCDLMQVGSWLDNKGYGIAMPVNSPYSSAISGAVLKMQESGELHILKKRWWKEMLKSEACEDDKQSSDESTTELGLPNVGGIFVVLTAGVVIAFFISIGEFLWNVRKIAVKEHITPWDAFVSELKFAMNIWVTKKATKPRLLENTSEM